MIDRKDAHEIKDVNRDELSYDSMALRGIEASIEDEFKDFMANADELREKMQLDKQVHVSKLALEGTEDDYCVYRAMIYKYEHDLHEDKFNEQNRYDRLYWIDANGDIAKSMDRQAYIDQCKKERDSKSRSETTLSEFGEISDGKAETSFEVGTSV